MIEKLEDLQPDPENANEGTLRGQQLLDRSLEDHGAGRSIVVDRNGVVISGNKTLETAVARGFKARVVETDGGTLVVVQRTDLDANDPKTRQLVYLDNRAAELGLKWSPEQLEKDLMKGLELGTMFTAQERDALLQELSEQEVTTKVAFDNVAQYQQFLDFIAYVTKNYPSTSVGGSVTAWAAAQMEQFSADEVTATE